MTQETPSRAILVHGLDDAIAAFASAEELGVPLVVISAVAAAAHGGASWFQQVVAAASRDHPRVCFTAILDCGDRAGDAQGALALGVSPILYTGRSDVGERLSEIAHASGLWVLTSRPATLDTRNRRDPRLLCRAWLSGLSVPDP